jgi:hypothetical protein
MSTFKLVNPIILGKINTTIKKQNANEAAESIWKNISEHISENVANFAFTIKNDKNNKYYNYMVSEKYENDKVAYNIKRINANLKDNDKKLLEINNKNIDNVYDKLYKEYGGKDYEEINLINNDGDKQLSEEFIDKSGIISYNYLRDKIRLYNYINGYYPIYYVYYYPVYYNLNNFFMPMFNATPYVEINLSSVIF